MTQHSNSREGVMVEAFVFEDLKKSAADKRLLEAQPAVDGVWLLCPIPIPPPFAFHQSVCGIALREKTRKRVENVGRNRNLCCCTYDHFIHPLPSSMYHTVATITLVQLHARTPPPHLN
jgi:hypothetical protein